MADRVLLVDDNLTNLQVLYQALEVEGYELLVAQSGEEALAIAMEAKPALVLLDINMPGIDGYETCRRLKAAEETAGATVVFLSARGALDDKLVGFDSGAVDFISKPFQFEEVVARVRKHLEAWHREQGLESEKRELEAKLGEGFREMDVKLVRELISTGETDAVEFKSTLRKNLHTNKLDKKMENASLKTLAGFLNTAGGWLFVGVKDDGDAIGMESDGFPNEDKMLLYLISMVSNHLGGDVVQSVKAGVVSVDDQRVLAIQCLRSVEPVYFRRENEEHFYVRAGPSTQSLSLSETVAYLAGRQ
jgi:putative two-component system response regulator